MSNNSPLRKLSKALIPGITAAALVAGTALSGTASAQDQVRWKMPVAFASKLPGLGSPSQYVAKQLKAASGGSLEVRVYEPDKLIPTFEILQ